MTTDTKGFELWPGGKAPEVLLTRQWTSVAQVAEGHGMVANDGAKPAVGVNVVDSSTVLPRLV